VISLVAVLAALVLAYLFPRTAVVVMVPVVLVARALPQLGTAYLLPAAVVGAWVLGLLTGRWPLNRFHLKAGVLASLLVVSYVWAPAGHALSPSATGFYGLITMIGLSCAASSFRPPTDAVLWAMVTSGLIVAVTLVTGGIGPFSVIDVNYGPYTRAEAFGIGANYLGILMGVAATAAFGYALYRRRAVVLLAVLPMIAALPALKSRQALVMIAAGAVLVVAYQLGSRRPAVAVGVVAVMLGAGVLLAGTAYQSALGSRASRDLSSSDAAREAAIPVAISVGLAHPLLGIGDGNFPEFAAADPRIGLSLSTHNDFLRVFAEFGAPAFLAFGVVVWGAVRSARRRDRTRTMLPVLCIYLLSLFGGNTLSVVVVSCGFFVLLGTAAGLPLPEPSDATPVPGRRGISTDAVTA
jgi:hypothetical protein